MLVLTLNTKQVNFQSKLTKPGTLFLNAEELKSALTWSESETPKRLESLKDALLFPCKKAQNQFQKENHPQMYIRAEEEEEKERRKKKEEETSFGKEKEEGAKAAACRAISTAYNWGSWN